MNAFIACLPDSTMGYENSISRFKFRFFIPASVLFGWNVKEIFNISTTISKKWVQENTNHIIDFQPEII